MGIYVILRMATTAGVWEIEGMAFMSEADAVTYCESKERATLKYSYREVIVCPVL